MQINPALPVLIFVRPFTFWFHPDAPVLFVPDIQAVNSLDFVQFFCHYEITFLLQFNNMKLSTPRYSCCLFFQLAFILCDLIFNCVSLFPRSRDGLLVLFM